MTCALNQFSLGFLVAISLPLFGVPDAYSFDFDRFSSDIRGRSIVSLPAGSTANRNSTKDFVLEPTGVLAHEDKNEKVNIHSVAEASNDTEMDVAQKSAKSAELGEKLNNIGTETKQPAQSVCGPSPLRPDEIEALVKGTADIYGVDPNLATAIAWTESRFDQQRNSLKGARGPMQLIPETAARYGISDICDPRSNIDAGVRHLRSLLDEFKNPLLAAAAYNAGEKAIYDYGGIPPYGETVRYVSAVVNRQLGLQLPNNKPPSNRQISPREQAQANQMPDGVMGAEPRRFVAGVMQF